MRRSFVSSILIITFLSGVTIFAQKKAKKAPKALQWKVQQLHKDNNEGIAVGDIDGDGKLDISSGEYWYQNPDFKKRKVRTILPFGKDYMQNNSEHLYDIDGDGDLDIVAGAFTLPIVNWFENPGKDYDSVDSWQIHELIDTGTKNNEATFLEDIDGDGTPEWLENQWKPTNPMEAYRFAKDESGKPILTAHRIGEINGHGQGLGDINGDGLKDIVFMQGWFEQPKDGAFSGPWKHHTDFVLPHASCPILVLDVDSDGDNDLIWGDGHNYGLYWQEQLAPGADGTTTWKQHLIDKKFSQVHALAWDDIDNDGAPELITGKRYYAHSGNDKGAQDPNTVHYYDLDKENLTWTKKAIASGEAGQGPGIGLQIRIADLDDNGWKDVIVPGKSGTHILWNYGWNE
ncbi:MAG: VCBS repeat-containing protein [Verrucomicrobiales bacterium]|nr:VCBS repeat-containing protein [Verrucomicrobiales bacterium]